MSDDKRTCSASSPFQLYRKSTQNYYTIAYGSFPDLGEFGIKDRLVGDCRRPIRDLLRIALVYNSRISELLNTTYGDIIVGSRLIVHGTKHSRDYIIYLPGLSAYRQQCGGVDASQKIWDISYKQAWTQIKKHFSFPLVRGRKNDSVYHIGRYLVVQAIEQQGLEVNLQDILRHNSSRSQSYYIQ